jgi:hypothetical protein
VWSELQVNTNLKNANRQYIIQSKWKDPNQGYFLASLGPLSKELKENYPNLVAIITATMGSLPIFQKTIKVFGRTST